LPKDERIQDQSEVLGKIAIPSGETTAVARAFETRYLVIARIQDKLLTTPQEVRADLRILSVAQGPDETVMQGQKKG
jgi:hypothetical protein